MINAGIHAIRAMELCPIALKGGRAKICPTGYRIILAAASAAQVAAYLYTPGYGSVSVVMFNVSLL